MLDKYDDKTKKSIIKFSNDLMDLFPGLFTEEEIFLKIENGLNKSIDFDCELPNAVLGQYYSNDKFIKISKEVSNEKISDIVFHELIHCITRDYSLDKDLSKNKYICEVLTTMIEKMYLEKKDGKKYDRVNGYISDFGEQLYIIYGADMFKKFLKEPSKVYECFSSILSLYDTSAKFTGYKMMSRKMQTLVDLIGQGSSEAVIKDANMDLEELILFQLTSKIELEGFSSDNMLKLEKLYESQHYPSYTTYLSYIQRFIQNEHESIKDYEWLNSIYRISLTNDPKELIDLYKTFEVFNKGERSVFEKTRRKIVSKIFGFEDEILNIDFENEDLDEYYIDKEKWLTNEKVYNSIFRLLVDGEIDVNELDNISYDTENNDDKEFSNMLKRGKTNSEMDRLFSLFFSDERKEKITSIYNNDELSFIFDENNNIYNKINVNEIEYKDEEFISKQTFQLIELLKERKIEQVFYNNNNSLSFDGLFDKEKVYAYRQDENNNIIRIAISNNDNNIELTESKVEFNGKQPVFSKYKNK